MGGSALVGFEVVDRSPVDHRTKPGACQPEFRQRRRHPRSTQGSGHRAGRFRQGNPLAAGVRTGCTKRPHRRGLADFRLSSWSLPPPESWRSPIVPSPKPGWRPYKKATDAPPIGSPGCGESPRGSSIGVAALRRTMPGQEAPATKRGNPSPGQTCRKLAVLLLEAKHASAIAMCIAMFGTIAIDWVKQVFGRDSRSRT